MEQIIAFLEDMKEIVFLYAVDVVAAIFILIAGFIVARWVRARVGAAVQHSKRLDATLKPLFANFAYYGILAVVAVMVLGQFGVETASILAALAAAGLAIGLALQGTLSNIAAGMMLIGLKHMRVGDYIDAGGNAGTVEEIGIFATRLKTFDGIYLAVPNSEIWGNPIINYSRNPTRRMDIEVGIAYDDDIDAGLAVMMRLMREDPRVLDDPAPETMVKSLGDSSVNLNMRCWAKTEDYWGLLWDLKRLSKVEIEKAGLSIPFPQRDVHHYREAAAEAAE
ncbi:MAG: mechanosensitive ion channel family protein [Flavobacteriaceae bacterium]